MGLYGLAETLCMTVTRLKEEMTWVEYLGWVEFYKERDRKQDADSGNLLAMDPDDIMRKFGG